MPAELNEIIYYVAAFIFVIALILIGARILKGSGSKGGSKSGGSFLRGRERRLGVVEAASVDGRRKLILLRRDNVEHLIMTGGPVDVVVETGIQSSPEEAYGEVREEPSYEEPRRQPVFEKPSDDGQVTIARNNDESAAPSYERETSTTSENSP